jgi:hypothetical protein
MSFYYYCLFRITYPSISSAGQITQSTALALFFPQQNHLPMTIIEMSYKKVALFKIIFRIKDLSKIYVVKNIHLKLGKMMHGEWMNLTL